MYHDPCARPARGLLMAVERRLARFNRSREMLLRGEEGHEEDEPARDEEGRPSRGGPAVEGTPKEPADDPPAAWAGKGGRAHALPAAVTVASRTMSWNS